MKTCDWTKPTNGILGEVTTGCGKAHLAIDMLDYKYCPYCRKPIGGEIYNNLLRYERNEK